MLEAVVGDGAAFIADAFGPAAVFTEHFGLPVQQAVGDGGAGNQRLHG